jgi:gas vesicle protein
MLKVIAGTLAKNYVFGNLVKKSERAAKSVVKSAGKEVNEIIEHLFDENLNPLADRLDYIAKKRIAQVGNTSKQTIRDLSTLKDELKSDIDTLLSDVDETYKENLKLTFNEINQARAEAIRDLREQLGETTEQVDKCLETRINQISLALMQTLKQVQFISDQFTPDEIREKLTKPTLEQFAAIEEKIFLDAEQIINKIDEIITGTLQEIRNLLKSILLHTLPNPLDQCRQRLNIAWKSGLSLSDIEIYELTECIELSKLNENLAIDEVIKIYSQLELNAARMTALARNAKELRKRAIQDWIKYGMLCEFWQSAIAEYNVAEPRLLEPQQHFLTGTSNNYQLDSKED